MNYREELAKRIDTYFKQVIMVYHDTTMAAMKDARKLSLFRKRDFSKHVENFRKHKEDAEKLDVSSIDFSVADEETRELVNYFTDSIQSFSLLCEKSMLFYEVCQQKQYRGSGIGVEDFTDAFNTMQEILGLAMEKLQQLETAYKEYNTDHLTDQ